MTVEELINELKKFPSDLEVIWEDTIEGNDCPVEKVYKGEYDITNTSERKEGIFISPCSG